MFKKVLATLATLLLAGGLSVVAVAAPASAHTPTVTSSCNSLSVELTSYETSKNNPKPNSVTVSVDGQQIYSATFGASLAKQTFPLDGTVNHTYSVVIDAIGGTNNTQYDVTKTGSTTACVLPPTPGTNSVDCTAATIYTNRQLTNGDHINMDVTQNGTKFQLNASVDIRQSQDPASESGLVLRIHQKSGPDIVLPISNAQKQTGTFTFTYSTYLTGKWTVEWVQFNSSYFNQDRDKTKFITCGSDPQDAAATVSQTTPTCEAGATLVLDTPTNATWGTPVYTGSNYEVTATAAEGHLFSNGTNKLTLTGTLSPPDTTLCPIELKCLPKSAVSYSYDPATNSGNVRVVNPDPTKYSNELCEGFWVTAASWYYTTDSVWPQIRNQVQKLDKITSVGTYQYKADVVCGQGDIYASYVAQPDPTPTLAGPNNPFTEDFLHEMGFGTDTPGPTYTQQFPGCNKAPVEEPTYKTITECGTYGSIIVPADTASIDYTLTGNGQTGINTVTAVAISPYVLKGYPAGGWTIDLGAYYDCPVNLTATYVPACTPDESSTFSVYNPSEESIVITLPGGATHMATPGYSTFDVAKGSRSVTFTWGGNGTGIASGSYEARAGADLPADDPACIKLTEPVNPTIVLSDKCDVHTTITAVDTEGIDYSEVTFNEATGEWSITATPKFGYHFANNEPSIVLTGTVAPFEECVDNSTYQLNVEECTYNEDGTANFRGVVLHVDNSTSTKATYVDFANIDGFDQSVPAGAIVDIVLPNMYPGGGGYSGTVGDKSFDIPIIACDETDKPEPKVDIVPTESFECGATQVTISTVTTTTDWTFDTELLKWVEQAPVVGEPVITYRDVTAADNVAAKCIQTVTDPEASTCELTDATDLTSWIRIDLNENVEYKIDGVVVTEEYTAVSAGEHTVTADGLNGYTLSGGNPDVWTDTHHEWTITAIDAATECVPTLPIEPTLEGSTAAGECIANAPWIFFSVTLNDPDGISTSDIAHLIMDDGVNSQDIELGELVADPANPGKYTLSGKVLWPGAAVAEDGVTPTAWPGWKQNDDGTWSETTGNFAWTRELTEVTLSVNPQVVASLEYPPASPDCDPNPPIDPPTLATVTPTFASTALTCTAAGSYTLGEVAEGTIQWTVNGNKVAVGTYPVTSAQTLTFEATPVNAEDGLDEAWTNPKVVTFSPGAEPCDKVALAMTGATFSFGLIWVGALLALTGIGFVLIRRRRTATEE